MGKEFEKEEITLTYFKLYMFTVLQKGHHDVEPSELLGESQFWSPMNENTIQ